MTWTGINAQETHCAFTRPSGAHDTARFSVWDTEFEVFSGLTYAIMISDLEGRSMELDSCAGTKAGSVLVPNPVGPVALETPESIKTKQAVSRSDGRSDNIVLQQLLCLDLLCCGLLQNYNVRYK